MKLRSIFAALAATVLLASIAGAVASNYQRSVANVFTSEGGYTNDPRDPGGPTNFGITIHDAKLYGAEYGWVTNPTAADVRRMPKDFAEKVYRAKYWATVRGDELPTGLDYSLFDYGVNSGVSRAGKVLRRVMGMPSTNWHVTDEVLAEVKLHDAKVLIRAVNDERLRFLKGLRTWSAFGGGWGRRVASVRTISLLMTTGQKASGFGYQPALGPHKAYEETEEVQP